MAKDQPLFEFVNGFGFHITLSNKLNETLTWVDEPSRVRVEASGDGIQCGKLAECIDDIEHHLHK
jgi:hypothetical protein